MEERSRFKSPSFEAAIATVALQWLWNEFDLGRHGACPLKARELAPRARIIDKRLLNDDGRRRVAGPDSMCESSRSFLKAPLVDRPSGTNAVVDAAPRRNSIFTTTEFDTSSHRHRRVTPSRLASPGLAAALLITARFFTPGALCIPSEHASP